MSGVGEAQARIAAITGRLDQLSSRRATVDPMALAAFQAQLSSATSAASGTRTATGLSGAPGAAAGPGATSTATGTATSTGVTGPAGAGAAGAAGVHAAARPAWAAAGTDLAGVFAEATARFSLPEGLLQAVAQKESGMRTDAVSPAGARGLMQLMPGTAAELGVDPMDPVQAVDGAARYLRQQLDAFGSVDLALAAYNAGPGAVRRHGGIPPYAETQDYVRAVTAAMQTGRAA